MIKIENREVNGFEAALRGMRNPLNSWGRSDSECLYHAMANYSADDPRHADYTRYLDEFDLNLKIGENDHNLAMRLAKAGPVHAKYRRMIAVYADVTAPLYW